MNKVELVGRLAATPKAFQAKASNGCSFTLAVSRTSKDENGNRSTDFPNIVAWGKTADLIMKYGPGTEFMGIVGTIRTFVTQKNGKKVYNTVINAENIQFYGFKKKNTDEKPSKLNGPSDFNVFGGYNGDVPPELDELEDMFANDLSES